MVGVEKERAWLIAIIDVALDEHHGPKSKCEPPRSRTQGLLSYILQYRTRGRFLGQLEGGGVPTLLTLSDLKDTF